MKGNPRCPECNGRGAIMLRGRFVVCTCVRGSKDALRAQHEQRMNDPAFAAFIRQLHNTQPGEK